MVCYLDRGHGAAIRRARTRLPGGKSNPVAVIRVPRERMISHGIASSLIHEVGPSGRGPARAAPASCASPCAAKRRRQPPPTGVGDVRALDFRNPGRFLGGGYRGR
jgi:hypothetical protein